jgi:hypothetical protein
MLCIVEYRQSTKGKLVEMPLAELISKFAIIY